MNTFIDLIRAMPEFVATHPWLVVVVPAAVAAVAAAVLSRPARPRA